MRFFRSKKPAVLVFFAILLTAAAGNATYTLMTLHNVRLKNSLNRPSYIPYFGSKVLTIIYSDYEARDAADPLAETAKRFADSDFKGIAVVNLADNPVLLQDWVARQVIKYKEKKYNTPFLFDDNHILPREWGLGDCNDISVLIIIGKDKRIKYISKVRNIAESRAIVDEVIRVVEREVKR